MHNESVAQTVWLNWNKVGMKYIDSFSSDGFSEEETKSILGN